MAQQSHKKSYKKPEQPQLEMRIVQGIVDALVALYRLIFGKSSPRRGLLSSKDAAELATHFQELEAMLSSTQLAKLAVSEADKLLDRAMLLAGAEGAVFADRLRSFESKFEETLYQEIWEAHKLRNRLAHEVGVEFRISDARSSIVAFRKALRALGVSL